MPKYNFYYDESEHSRKINYTTISASNYYDNFITMIVGWSTRNDDILQLHADFETKYADRQNCNGEIKSTMLRQKQFKYGFASLNRQNAQFIYVFDTFYKDIHFTFPFPVRLNILYYNFSRITETIFSLMQHLMKYSIIKALVMYQSSGNH